VGERQDKCGKLYNKIEMCMTTLFLNFSSALLALYILYFLNETDMQFSATGYSHKTVYPHAPEYPLVAPIV
jgi:hypothetical protein